MNNLENRDYLTGLYNRQGLFDEFDRIDRGNCVQVLFIDLDNFKTVNDMYGHKAGDNTLVRFADILRDVSPEGTLKVRLGGDEFVLIIPGSYDKDEISALADRILRDIHRKRKGFPPFDIISASIGIVWNAVARDGLDDILNSSDAAMYKAKELGKNNFVFFDDYRVSIETEYEMETTAALALAEKRFILRYHPVVHLQSGRLIRTEACCVWTTADGREWGRNDFRPVLEKSGFIREVDLYIFEQLCRDVVRFKDEGRVDDIISIQFSYLLLLQNDLQDILSGIMDRYGASPDNFEIILEENAFSARDTGHIIDSMKRMHEAGFKFSLSRFGEDFSSFRYLEDIPIDAIRFDADYVEEKLRTQKGRMILGTLSELGNDLHLLIIGCGVADSGKADFLRDHGCDGASGSLYSGQLPLWDYIRHIQDTYKENNTHYEFLFRDDLKSTDGVFSGRMVGDGPEYAPGISDIHGGINFPGGRMGDNLVSFPPELINSVSHTIAMWVKPAEIQSWISAWFVLYTEGFESFMHTVTGGVSIYRMHRYDNESVWYDGITHAIPLRRWSFIAATYEEISRSLRFYVNGEIAAAVNNVPDMGGIKEILLGGDIYQVSFRGVISGLHIYESALSSDDIADLYRRFTEEPGFCGDMEAESEVEYFVHDPAIYEDADRGRYYMYTTEGRGWTSGDLVHWDSLDRVVPMVPAEALDWTGSEAIWAPDIVRYGDEYRLYCSNSSWGVQKSCIFLAISDSPAGPFLPRGIVLKTDETLDVNGIDANIITDHITGEQYMLYGSFWGGVHLIPLDASSGLPRDAGSDGSGVGSLRLMPDYREGMTIEDLEEEERVRRRGICLCKRPPWTSGSVEGPYMIYHPGTDYYYLFVSYGSLKSDYNIRVGRSRSITGPFVDYQGRDLNDPKDTDCTTGLMIHCGYKWFGGLGFMAPGHNSVLLRESEDMYMVSHIRRLAFGEDDPGPGILQIRRMFITPDGWPIVQADVYSHETYPLVRDEVIPGDYERIELRPSVPQGIMYATPMTLGADGQLTMSSVVGRWERTGDYELRFEYGDTTEYIHIEKGRSLENEKTTVLLTGLTSTGLCTWGKKRKYY